MKNKWPKHVRENRDMFARRAHPSCTRGAQPLRHRVVINAQYTEYEASGEFVLISSKRRENEQGLVDEPEIYGRHYTQIVIHPEKTLRIYYAH